LKSSLNPDEQPKREAMMDSELEHLLKTYSDHEVMSEQDCLRDFLIRLRRLAEELQLDFEEALTQSDRGYQHRFLLTFGPCL
jgi:hypothetical protein